MRFISLLIVAIIAVCFAVGEAAPGDSLPLGVEAPFSETNRRALSTPDGNEPSRARKSATTMVYPTCLRDPDPTFWDRIIMTPAAPSKRGGWTTDESGNPYWWDGCNCDETFNFDDARITSKWTRKDGIEVIQIGIYRYINTRDCYGLLWRVGKDDFKDNSKEPDRPAYLIEANHCEGIMCKYQDDSSENSTPGVMTWPELSEHMDNLGNWDRDPIPGWYAQAK